MDQPPIVYSASRNEQEERNFRQLFTVILNKIINMEELLESDVENAITEIIQNYKQISSEDKIKYIFPDMRQWKYLCGYLFRYAPHGAGLTRNRVLEAVRKSEDLTSCLLRTDLSIVSLGGGPGNDIMGFCSALFECIEKSQSKDKKCNLNITVIDRYDEWSVCVSLLKKLVMEGKFGNGSELLRLNNVRMSFLQVNISAGLTRDEDFFHFLRKADIILMVKLILSLDVKSVDCLIETLKKTMKDEALILYIDAPIRPMVTNHFDVLFQSNLENYCMSSEIYERFKSNDNVESKAQIAVLRKSGSSPAKKMRIQ